jgi:hypothetical protein
MHVINCQNISIVTGIVKTSETLPGPEKQGLSECGPILSWVINTTFSENIYIR